MTPLPTLLGIDIGGSKTRAAFSLHGRPPAHFTTTTANPASVGDEQVGRVLDEVAARCGGQPVDAVTVGAAGVDSPEAMDRMRDLVVSRFRGARVEVVHDSRLVLAAAGLDVGMVLISGTGSVCWGRGRDGQEARAGGWGYLLGDEGSGYGVTRHAIQRALLDVDAARAPSALTLALLDDCGLERPWQLLNFFYEKDDRAYWARKAGLAFDLAEAGDPESAALVQEAAAALADLARSVRARLEGADDLVLAGGLVVHQQLLSRLVAEALRPDGLTRVQVLRADPVDGAIRLAARLVEPATDHVDGVAG